MWITDWQPYIDVQHVGAWLLITYKNPMSRNSSYPKEYKALQSLMYSGHSTIDWQIRFGVTMAMNEIVILWLWLYYILSVDIFWQEGNRPLAAVLQWESRDVFITTCSGLLFQGSSQTPPMLPNNVVSFMKKVWAIHFNTSVVFSTCNRSSRIQQTRQTTCPVYYPIC